MTVESSPVFEAYLEDDEAVDHARPVKQQYDLIGGTLLRKREFDAARHKQEQWIRSSKQRHSSVPGLVRQTSRLPGLVEPSPASITRKRRRELVANSRKARKVSLVLGNSTHQVDLARHLSRAARKKAKASQGYEVLEFMVDERELEHLCNANVTCQRGTVADIKCYSCVKYDPLMQGNFCEPCFRARHPAYRVQHHWVTIDKAPPPPKQAWNKQMLRIEKERKVLAYRHVLGELRALQERNAALAAPEALEKRIRAARGRQDAAQDTLRSLRRKLPRSYTEDEAAAKVQGLWRACEGRRAFARLIKSVYLTQRDAKTGKPYYVNRMTGEMQWERPKVFALCHGALGRSDAARRLQQLWRRKRARDGLTRLLQLCVEKHIDKRSGKTYYLNTRTRETMWHCPAFLREDQVLSPRSRAAAAALQAKKDRGVFKSADKLSEAEAARMIQGRFRVRRCRRRIEQLLLEHVKKIVDPGTGKCYYFNTRTGETSWQAPRLVAATDIAEYDPAAAAATSAKAAQTKKRAKRQFDSPEEAARALQGMYRRKKARDRLRLLLLCQVEKHFDEASGKWYYFNRKTQATTWTAPSILREEDVLTASARARKEDVERKKAEGRFRTADMLTEEEAAIMVQSRFRARRAAQGLRTFMLSMLRKVRDDETGKVYYYNLHTEQTMWQAPALLRGASIESLKGPRVFHSREEAASALQAMYRRKRARDRLRALLSVHVEKHFDEATNSYYFYNAKTGTTTWHAPQLLGEEGVLTPRSRQKAAASKARANKKIKMAQEMTETEAAVMVQSAFRTRRARNKMRELLLGVITKAQDENGNVYVINKITGQTSWTLPTLLRDLSKSKLRSFKRTPRVYHSREEAASALQAMYRLKRARDRVRAMLLGAVSKARDGDGNVYYIHEKTGLATYIKPTLLRDLSDSKVASFGKLKPEVVKRTPRVYHSREEAASALQAMFRRKRARDRVRAMLLGAVSKARDGDGNVYYIHEKTGHATYIKPTLLRDLSDSKVASFGKLKPEVVKRTPRVYHSREEAASALQAMFRRKRARDRVRAMLLGAVSKARDGDGNVYYIHEKTGNATYIKPTLLRDLSDSKVASFGKLKPEVVKRTPRVYHSREEAASALQAMFRRKRARDRVRAMLLGAVSKARDGDGNVYYIHEKTGHATYIKPTLLRDLSDSKVASFGKLPKADIKHAEDMTEEEAAVMVQKRFRAVRARDKLRAMLLGAVTKARDEDGYVYYINAKTGEASWAKPTLLRDLSDSKLRSFSNLKKRAEDMTEEEAAVMVQKRFRAVRARDKLRTMLLGAVTKARDEDGYVYYVNAKTGEASWAKPTLLRDLSDSKFQSFTELETGAEGMSEEEAASKLQAMFRRKRARERVRAMLLAAVSKAKDDDGYVYYINEKTGHVSYTKPTLLRDLSDSKVVSYGKLPNPNIKRAEDMTEEEAAVMVQKRFRAVRARDKLRAMLLSAVTKAKDEDGNVYFFNATTGEASWTKPTLLRDISDSKMLSFAAEEEDPVE